jgi:hypothetical protein
VPNSNSSGATFGNAITAARTVTVDSPKTVATLSFASANAYTIAGTSAVTLDSSSGIAAINDSQGSHTISAPLTAATNLNVSVTNSSDTLTVTAPITFTAGLTVTKQGAGSVEVKGLKNIALNVAAGKVKIPNDGGVNGTSKLTSLSVTTGTGGTFNIPQQQLDRRRRRKPSSDDGINPQLAHRRA